MLWSFLVLLVAPVLAEDKPPQVKIDWTKVAAVSKAVPTLQVVVNPPLRRGSKIHDRVFHALEDLNADDVRFVPWLPYPRLAVAELEPPKDGKTSWDFSLIDPMMEDFMMAMGTRPAIVNFSTIPQWMFKTEKPVAYPDDPDKATWDYEQGKELRDPTFKEVADYYARLAGWYTQGGFTDELGRRHESGHHYRIAYWEVLNEVNGEHEMPPKAYTRLYDAVVSAVRRVDPRIKFVGLALSGDSNREYFDYFLDPRNHERGIPLDMISYHFYASPTPDQPPEAMQFTFWDQADHFIEVADYVDGIRERLSPETKTAMDELGAISAGDDGQDQPGHVTKPIPQSYWSLCAALYVYLYAELAKKGVDVAAESQLVGFPTQFPSVSMVDWETGRPNSRYWALKLLRDNFGPGDRLMATSLDDEPSVYAQAFLTREGRRKLLLVSKRDRPLKVSVPGADGARVSFIDQSTAFSPPAASRQKGEEVSLTGFEVAVLDLAE